MICSKDFFYASRIFQNKLLKFDEHFHSEELEVIKITTKHILYQNYEFDLTILC